MSHSTFRAYLLLTYLLAPLWFARTFLNRRRSRKGGKAPRVLIIPQTNRIGDLVCATPVFRAVEERYPDAFIGVLVSEKSAGIIEHNPRIDEIVLYEEKNFLKKIRSRKYVWGFALTADPGPSIIMLLAGIPNRVKTTISKRSFAERMTDWMNTERAPYVFHTFLPRHYLRLLASMGIKDSQDVREVFTTPAGEEWVDGILVRFGKGERFVGMSVTAGNKIKEWHEERFATLGDALVLQYGARVVLIGGAGDLSRIERVQSLMAHKEAVFVPEAVSLTHIPSLMKRLSLFIAVDTGPVYIAHALKVPLIDIAGPCDTREQPPSDERSISIAPEGIPPSIWVMQSPGPPEAQRRALEAITVPMVLEQVRLLHERIGVFQ